MKTSEEFEYATLIAYGDKFTTKAEQMYLCGNIANAVKHYYHASNLYEQAKELANKYLNFEQKLAAKEKEYYCLEKLDELKKFKGVDKEDIVK